MRLKTFFTVTFLTILFLFTTSNVSAQSTFRFVAWGDTKSGTTMLGTVSKAITPKNPVFLLYTGDVCDSGPNASCFDKWKTNYNAGGDFFSKSFAARGNHDGGTSFWVANFDVAGTVARIGGTNLSQLSNNLTYSFDYGNTHIAAIDLPGGSATSMSSAQISWLDSDLTQAESRGIVHSFIFFHGPVYPMGGHCCSNATSVAQMLGKHQSVKATFHGHEHNLAYKHVDNSVISGVTHPFEVFTTGGAGAGIYGCQRGDWCQATHGFMTIDVNNNSYTVTAFNSSGSTLKSWTFNSTGGTPPPTTPPTSTPKPTNTPNPAYNADVNRDGTVNIVDIGLIVDNYASSPPTYANADINNDGIVNIVDIGIVIDNYVI